MAKPVSRNLNAYGFIISGINPKPMYKHQAVIDFDCQRERKITQRASVIRIIVFAEFFIYVLGDLFKGTQSALGPR